MIKAVVVDSEPEEHVPLCLLLQLHCPQVAVAALCRNCNSALDAILLHQPDLLFLDAEAPDNNCFELLEQVHDDTIEVIFVSRHEHHAVKAIRVNALGYLVRPVDAQELQEAVGRAMRRSQKNVARQISALAEMISHPAAPVHKIALPTQQGLQMVHVDLIVSCASDSNYSVLYLKGKQKIVVSRTLKEVEEMLHDYPFVRVHHSHLVNLNEVEKYIKGEGGCLVMSDGTQIDVSRSRKEALLHKLLHHKR